MKCAVGDVILLDIGPFSDEYTIAGVRPGVFLREEGNVALVIPLTTNLKRLRFPSTTLIKPDDSNRLKEQSVALIFQLQAYDAKRIVSRIGALSEKDKRTIDGVLRKVVRLQ